MNVKLELEKSLKHFVKGKKIGFSLATLVFLLINGNLGYANTVTPTREEIDNSIGTILEKVNSNIKENNESIKDIDLEMELLLRQGRFYTKPLTLSSQFFWSFYGQNRSENRDKTHNNFNEGEYSDPYYQGLTSEDGVLLPNINSFGIVKRPVVYADEISFGANIKPKPIKEKNVDIQVDSNFEKIKLNIPKVSTPGAITPPVANFVKINLERPSLPGEVKVNIAQNIQPIEKIEIGSSDVKAQKITPATISPITITPPNPQFSMKIIGEVGAPELPKIEVPSFHIPKKAPALVMASDVYSYWAQNAAVLSNLSIESGEVSFGNIEYERNADGSLKYDKDWSLIPTKLSKAKGKNFKATIFKDKKSISDFKIYTYEDTWAKSGRFEFEGEDRNVLDKIPDQLAGNEPGEIDVPYKSQIAKTTIKFIDIMTNAPFIHVDKDVKITSNISKIGTIPDLGVFFYLVQGPVYLGANLNYPYRELYDYGGLEDVYSKFATLDNYKEQLNAYFGRNGSNRTAEDFIKELRSYQKYSNIMGQRERPGSEWNNNPKIPEKLKKKREEFLFVNNGTVTTNGRLYSYLMRQDDAIGQTRTGFLVNDKDSVININGEEGIGYNFSTANKMGIISQPSSTVVVNKGTINVNGDKAVGLLSGIGWQANVDTGFFSIDGKINVAGKNSSGVTYGYNEWATSGDLEYIGKNSLLYITNPISVYADNSVGFISANNGPGTGNEKNVVKVDIANRAPETNGDIVENSNSGLGNKEFKNGKVDYAVGIFQYQRDYYNHWNPTKNINETLQYIDKTDAKIATVINIGDFSINNIGIYASAGKINIIPHEKYTPEETYSIDFDKSFKSEINIRGGEKNSALLAKNLYEAKLDKTYFNNDGIIDFTGNINVTGGKDHRVIVSSGEIDIDGDIKIGIDDSNRLEGIKAFYAFSKPKTNVPGHISGIINVKQGKNMHLYLGDNSIGVISDNGRVTFDGGDYNRETNSGILPNISLKLSNENNNDVGLYAGNGGQIKGENLKYEFINPLVGVSSDGKNDKNENSDITLNGSEVTYKGKGYAFQTKDGGTIHFENGVLNIDGSASLTKLDITSPDQALFMNGSKINIKSNDVSLFYLNNQSTPLNTSNLAGTILGKVGITVSETNPITNIIKYNDAPLYTFLTMNGGHIVVDSTVDRNNPDDIFGSRTKIQKSIIDIGINSNPGTISAVVDETRGKGILNDNIVGMAISSANGATSKDDTQINLGADGKIIAKKNYASSIGAMGAYINFGKVDNKGVIQVEKDSNKLKGIGIFATNGSEITNSGTVETGGLKGIGIYTTALREDGGSVFKDSNNQVIPGQGTLNITNSGTITVGSGGIGIYAKNNGDKAAQDNIVTNTKDIIVGDSNDSPSVGILGDKVTIVNKDVAGNSNGTVQVGKKGIGIYATNQTNIKNPGTLALSDGSIGIKVDSTSSIETSDPVKLVNSSGNNLVENTIGVFFDTVANLPSALKVDMSGSNFKSSTLYTGGKSGETINLESDINISGQNNAGITVPKDVNLTYNGVITVETKNPDDKGNIGIVAVDGNTVDTKSSTFNLNGEGGTGVYVINSNPSKLKVSGSTINLNGKDNSGITIDKSEFSANTQLPTIIFAANSGSEIKNNKGIYAINGSTINMDKALNLTIPEGAGIFVHLENSAINVKEDFTLNGGVGIYAEKDGTVTVDSGKNIAVNSGGIGIKSGSGRKDGSNTINLNGNVVVSGQKSIGLYSDNLTVLNGNGKFDIKNKGVGIYLNSGHIKAQEMKLDIDDATTGMYVTESSQLGEDGNTAKVVITNKNSGVNGVGIFFVNDDPTNTTQISDNDNLELNGNNITGRYYSSKSYRLENGNTVLNGTGYIGNYLESESQIAANGTVSSNNGDKNIAYYVDKGKLSILTGGAINITDNNGTSGTESVGVVIKGEGNKNRGIVDNDGVITVTGDGIGIYASDSNYTINNRGSVVANSDGNIRAAGIYLKGTNNSTDNNNAIEFYNSGSVKADDLAIYLENIGEKDKTVNMDKDGNTQGKLVLTGKNSIGVFAKNSYITFNPGEVERNSSGKIKALVTATDNSTFAIRTLNMKNNEGVALIADGKITFIPGSEIVVDSNNSVGMVAYNWLAPAEKIENVKITSNGDNGAGIYITQDSGNSSDIFLNSTVVQNGDGGTGVYISKDAKVTTGAVSEIVVNKGIGYYIAGELNAQNGKINTSDDGTAFFVDEGTLNLGSGYKITGNGTLISGKNYSSEVSTDMSVPKIGLVGEYDKDSTVDKKLAINNGATMTLTKDDAVGIYATVNPTDAPDHHIANVNVTLENRGTIGFANGIKKTIGIYGKGTNILNSGKIDVSTDGYGIFATNKDSKVDTSIANSNEIKLNGNGTGIYLSKMNTTEDVTVGKITSAGDSNKGVYVKDAAGSVKLKDADITVNNNSQGIIVNNSNFSVKDSKIAINSSSSDENAKSVGVFTNNGVGNIENTLIDAGTNGIGLYAIGASGDVKIDLGDGTTKGIKLGENTKSTVGIVAQEGTVGIKGNLYTNSGVGIDISDNGQLRMDDTATINVNGVKGLGLELINGRIVNSDKLTVDVTSSDAQGIYVNGSVNGSPSNTILPVVNLQADNTKAYIFENTDTALEIPKEMTLNKKDQIGLLTKGHGTQPVTLNGLVVSNEAKGVVNEGDYHIINKGKLDVNDSLNSTNLNVGIFSQGGKVEQLGGTTVGKNSYGIYTNNSEVVANGVVKVAGSGVGLAVNKGKLTTGNRLDVGDNEAIGVYIKESDYIHHNGDINVGGNNSIAIQGIDSENMNIAAGDMIIGNNSIGIYSKIKNPTSKVNSFQYSGNNIQVGDKGYAFYLDHFDSNSKGNFNINASNMSIGDEGVGVLVKKGDLNYIGDIHVGKTTIADKGYDDPSVNKNSVGIYNIASNVTYDGHMIVDKPLSVGLYSLGKGSNITIAPNATIEVKNGAFGVAGGVGTNEIINNGTIIVSGKAKDVDPNAPDSAVSYGIAAYSGVVENRGVIKVSDGATGIYVNGTAELLNNGGRIEISTGGQRVNGLTSAVNLTDIYGIEVTAKGNIVLGRNFINNGEIYAYSPRSDIRNGIEKNGTLIMDNMLIDITKGKIIVDAASIKGKAFATPEFSQGNNEKVIKIEDVFASKNVGLGTSFSGKVVSQSVSWLAKLINGKETGSLAAGDLTQTKDIVMIKVPYEKLIVGNKYKNFGIGLDELYSIAPPTSTVGKVFDDIDRVTDDATFDKKMAELRGDVYSNIQERIFNVQDAFSKSYKETLDSYNLTRNVDKYSVINYRSRHIDNTLGVNSYTTNTYGLLYLKDKERYTYGEKYGWSIGVAGTDVKFKGDINRGSKEKIGSLILGAHYQTPLNKEDHNARLKLLSRIEGTANLHKTYRNINLDNTYRLKSHNYASFNLALKNEIFYDFDYSTDTSLRPNIGLDINLGRINNIQEVGEGVKLDVKAKSYQLATLKAGIDHKTYIPISEFSDKRFVLGSHIEARYDLNKLYRDANQAKIQDTTAGYYNLSRPEVRRFSTPVGVDLGYEKANNYGVTLSVEAGKFKRKDVNYSVKFNYKF